MQQKKVEENTGLVYRVIADKVHGSYGIYSKEDLFQIGCIGLCKAVATDKGGCFSTYAYRLIRNEICDALIYSNRRWNQEVAVDVLPEGSSSESDKPELRMVMERILAEAEEEVPESTRKGIRAMVLMNQGYSSREIGESMGVAANLVCAWVSKARKYLRGHYELQQIANGYGYKTR